MTIPADTTPPPMTLAELDAIERRANAATPGPWYLVAGDDECCSSIGGVISDQEKRRIEADHTPHRGDFPEHTQWVVVSPGVSPVQLAGEDNFEFIAAVGPDRVLRLVALARRALTDISPAAPPPDADDATRLAAKLRAHYERVRTSPGETITPILTSEVRAVADHLEALAATRAVLARCVAVLQEWADIHDEPCRFDHNGHCQAHYLGTRDDCIVVRTRIALADAARAGGKAEGRT